MEVLKKEYCRSCIKFEGLMKTSMLVLPVVRDLNKFRTEGKGHNVFAVTPHQYVHIHAIMHMCAHT